MASTFGHAVAAIALKRSLFKNIKSLKTLVLGIICTILPDADVIGFKYGVEYTSFWGHRGFSHSIVFAIGISLVLTFIFYFKAGIRSKVTSFIYLTICTISHGVLDAMTSGGRGVAFFSPFNNNRYFLPWRPIKVSPIGVERFFSEWGLKVILSEVYWVVIPALLFVIIIRGIALTSKT